VTVLCAHSLARGVDPAASELKEALSSIDPRLVLYFASPAYDPPLLAAAIQAAFPRATTAGCTSAGELANGRMLEGSAVAMAFDSTTISSVKAAAFTDLTNRADPALALGPFEAHCGSSLHEVDFDRYVGLLLVDGLSFSEEWFMDRLGDLTNLIVVGGSAGDDMQFKRTHVFLAEQALSNAAVLVVLEPARGFRVLKTQSCRPLGKKLRVTRADPERRLIHELDGQRATKAYAEAIGVPEDDVPMHFIKHPLGLMIGDEPFIRSPQRPADGSIVFYCNVHEGMELAVLESGDIVSDTKKALEAERRAMGGISAIVDFDCVLRRLELACTGRLEDYGKVFEGIPSIGFSTYGEQFVGHVNQTSTMLLVK
jgi:hypothetical protein